MGIFDVIKKQLIDVIEWRDETTDTVVYKYDDKDCEIKMNAQLIVRESQVAIFFNEGVMADIYAPGRHTLTTANMPILTTLKSWKYGFNSPFKCDIFFVSTKKFINQKWGTSSPIMMRDADFGVLRIRAFGMFSFFVKDPPLFLKEFVGTPTVFKVSNVIEHLRSKVVSGVSDAIAESKIPALDLATQYDELSDLSIKKLTPKCDPMGLNLFDFIIENISLPDEVNEAMDTKTKMNVINDMGKYTQFQAADALRDAAKNPGGMAGTGVGLGAGMGLGQVMSQAFQTSTQPQQQASAPQQPQGVPCIKCGKPLAPGAKFCPECGSSQTVQCIKCKASIPPNSKFCPECGQTQTLTCKKCGAPIDAATKFCGECGEAQ